MRVFRTVTRYEAFAREGAKVNYRADWHPGDGDAIFGTGVLREDNRQRNNPTVFFQARDP